MGGSHKNRMKNTGSKKLKINILGLGDLGDFQKRLYRCLSLSKATLADAFDIIRQAHQPLRHRLPVYLFLEIALNTKKNYALVLKLAISKSVIVFETG